MEDRARLASPHHPVRPPKALFLDRDGTLIEHVPYLHDPAGVVLLPGVASALARARAASVGLFLFTNQSGVGRGLFTLADVEAVNRRMLDLLGLGDDLFRTTCIAPEHPDEPSRYRKPSPRFIEEMLAIHRIDPADAWMVGDSAVDWEAGFNAGVGVAAIVSDPAVPKDLETRIRLEVPAYTGVGEFLADVMPAGDRG